MDDMDEHQPVIFLLLDRIWHRFLGCCLELDDQDLDAMLV